MKKIVIIIISSCLFLSFTLSAYPNSNSLNNCENSDKSLFLSDFENQLKDNPSYITNLHKPLFVPGELLVNFNVSINFSSAKKSQEIILSDEPSINRLNKQFKILSVEPVLHNTGIPTLDHCYLFRFQDNTDIRKAAECYSSNPYVSYAEPNYLYYASTIPNDPYFNTQWALHNIGQTGGTIDADIDAPEAWDLEQGNSEIIIAIIDTGVDYTNPDGGNHTVVEEEFELESKHPLGNEGYNEFFEFTDCDAVSLHIQRFNVSIIPGFVIKNNIGLKLFDKILFRNIFWGENGSDIWTKYSEYGTQSQLEVRADGPDDWGFKIDKIKKVSWRPLHEISPLFVDGYDFYFKNRDPMDDNGHGTHCAGIIAAVTNNSQGIAGVAPNCRIMPIKALGPTIGETTMTRLSRSIIYAVNHEADIISMSLGGPRSMTGVLALNYADHRGVVMVAAAGNENKNMKRFSFPASHDEVIAVAASDANDTKAVFSDYGSWIDVAAPGVDIVSHRAYGTDMYLIDGLTPPGANLVPPYDTNATLYMASGTSMACPHVAGVAGLILSKNPDLESIQVRTIIRSSIDGIKTNSYVGTGRVNAYTAVVKTAPVIAHLDSSLDDRKIKSPLVIKGIAEGEGFSYYEVAYAVGLYPSVDSWVQLANSSNPGEGALATLDPQGLYEGQYTIRLLVHANGYDYVDYGVIVVDNKPNTFYVDDDNSMGPWFGTPEHPFSHIQKGIDSCGAFFDKVKVNPGVYYESLTIGNDRSITVQGVDKYRTVICSPVEKSSGLSLIQAKFNSFEGFTISNFTMGAYLTSSSFNRIFNNILCDSDLVGVSLVFSVGNMFFDNSFVNTSNYHVLAMNSVNLWYNPIRFRGNYWDDYEKRYPDASPRSLMRWSWDIPYIVGQMWADLPYKPPEFLRFLWNNDRFPLVNPP